MGGFTSGASASCERSLTGGPPVYSRRCCDACWPGFCPTLPGMPTKLVGFDVREPTGHQGGKPRAIAELRRMFPYETVGG